MRWEAGKADGPRSHRSTNHHFHHNLDHQKDQRTASRVSFLLSSIIWHLAMGGSAKTQSWNDSETKLP